MVTVLDYFLVIDSLIQDKASKLGDNDRLEAVQQAVAEHNRVRPIIRHRQLSGTGGFTLGTPTGWDNDFSQVYQIEYPVGQRPPTYLGANEWLLLSSPTAATRYQLQFQEVSPASGAPVNLSWTIPHVVNEAGSTIPEGHYRAVATLGASYACLMLAGYYNQSGDPLISIDSQNPLSKAQDYMRLSDKYRQTYQSFFGLGKDGHETLLAASATARLTRDYSWGGDLFSHPKRWRTR